MIPEPLTYVEVDVYNPNRLYVFRRAEGVNYFGLIKIEEAVKPHDPTTEMRARYF